MKNLLFYLLTTMAIASAAHASTQYTLSDLTSTATFDSDQGLVDWVINGKDYLNQQWFWYRIGEGVSAREYSLNTLPSKQVKAFDNNFNTGLDTLVLRYADAALGLQVDATFTLAGVPTGSGTRSDISENITITNTGGDPLSLHFFQYTDLDLCASGDSVLFPDAHSVHQQASIGVVVSETVITPVPSYREVHEVYTTLNHLNDGAPWTLDGDLTQTASGDVSWAFQWDVLIPAGGSFQISKDKQIVPEPATATFLAGMISLMSLRLRRRPS
jgi:hypothetical protein